MKTTKVSIYRYFKNKFRTLKAIAKQKQLSFSNQDAVADNIIALDSSKKELVYLPGGHPSPGTIINLHDLSDCTLMKDYRSIDAGDLRKNKLQNYLKSIFLNLQFKNGTAPVKLSLYQAEPGNKDNA